MRLVLRTFGVGIPYSWYGFATRFEASKNFVGKDFFELFSRKSGATFIPKATAGLMKSFDVLASKEFDPGKVAPVIKDFYENTSGYKMHLKIWWNPIIKPFGKLYRMFYADRIKQTMIPLDNREFKNLDSWIQLIDQNHDNDPEFRCWIRVMKETGQPVYVGAYRVFKSAIDNHSDAYISVSFPIPFGSITTVLSPFNYKSNGLRLTTRDKKSTESGLYLIFPSSKSYSMIPALGLAEEFKLSPLVEDGKDVVDVEHTCYWLGMKAFVMRYKIEKYQRPAPTEAEVREQINAAVASGATADTNA